VAFSPDGKILTSGGHAIHLWDVAAGKYLATLKADEVQGSGCLAFNPDGKTLAAGGLLKDYAIRLWNVADLIDKPAAPEK
jgi:WD40 repeat protein